MHLNGDIAQNLIEDARQFLLASPWYSDMGIPHRRGYLLHGPAGCGKTSFCQAFAGELKLDICILTLDSKHLDDTRLATLLREAPINALILLEDVDAVFVNREINNQLRLPGVSFSGLLNAIDGVASQEGRILVMTTNHIDRYFF